MADSIWVRRFIQLNDLAEILSAQGAGFTDMEAGYGDGMAGDVPSWNGFHPQIYNAQSILIELFPHANPQVFEEAYQCIFDAHMAVKKSTTPDYSALRRAMAGACFWLNKVRAKANEMAHAAGPAKTLTKLAAKVSTHGQPLTETQNRLSVADVWPWRVPSKTLKDVAKHLSPIVKKAERTVKGWSVQYGWSTANRPNDREVLVAKDKVLKTLREMQIIQ